MKRFVLVISTLFAVPAWADVTVVDNGVAVTVDCSKDKVVTLVGNNIQATLTGVCTRVSATGNHARVTGSATGIEVAGNHNVFQLDGVDTISVMGNDNEVAYKKPLTRKKASVSNLGRNNKVRVAK